MIAGNMIKKNSLQTILLVLILAAIIYLIVQVQTISAVLVAPESKDSTNQGTWQILNWKFAIIFGTIASILALIQSILNVLQRKADQRWKQAELARSFTDCIYDDDQSHDALKMLDKINKQYSENKYEIKINDIYAALQSNNGGKELYIRECFDSLFYYIERIEHSIELKVIEFEDIKSHCEYYIGVIQKHENLLFEYCKLIRYNRAIKFIKRFKKEK